MNREPTSRDIDELAGFLPRLYARDFEPVKEWHGGRQPDGTNPFPFPEYDRVVDEFFDTVYQGCWIMNDYRPERAPEMIDTRGFIEQADTIHIKEMLTFCAQGEKFCDGHRQAMIEQGVIRRLLERLEQLRERCCE